MRSGSQLVSTTATTGMPSRLASATAISSFLVSITQSASGSLRMFLMPASVLVSVFAHLLLGERLDHLGVGHYFLELFQALDRLPDGLEVGQHPAQPAVVHVIHSAAIGLLAHDVLGLLLGADEKHRAALGGEVAHEVVSVAEHPDGLLKVENVNVVAGAEDVRFHLRVPAAGLVAEVNSGLQKLFHADFGHKSS